MDLSSLTARTVRRAARGCGADVCCDRVRRAVPRVERPRARDAFGCAAKRQEVFAAQLLLQAIVAGDTRAQEHLGVEVAAGHQSQFPEYRGLISGASSISKIERRRLLER
jgi:hypothetical protein